MRKRLCLLFVALLLLPFIAGAEGAALVDDRGATIVSFLSPSQLTAIVLFVVGAGLFAWGMLRERKHNSHGA